MAEFDAFAHLALATVIAGTLALGLAWWLYRAEVTRQQSELGRERQEHFHLLQAYLLLRAGRQDKAWRTHDELEAAQDRYDALFNARIGRLVSLALEKGSERDALQQTLDLAGMDGQASARLRLREIDAWFAREAADLGRRCACYMRHAPHARGAA